MNDDQERLTALLTMTPDELIEYRRLQLEALENAGLAFPDEHDELQRMRRAALLRGVQR